MKRHLSLLVCLVMVVALAVTMSSCDILSSIIPGDGSCEHEFVGEVTKEATCTEAGSETLTCTKCGYSETKAIDPKHTEETIAAVAPTCTEAGLTEGKKCSVCGEITVAQTEVPATGHTFVDGVCSVCEGKIVVKTTDTYTWIDEYTFTAAASGTYTFNVPAGLGVYSKDQYDVFGAAEVDYNDNTEGASFDVQIAAGDSFVYFVGALTKGEWTITWSFVEGEVEGDDPDVGATELVVGPNTVVFADGELSEGKIFDFVVTDEGTYTFNGDLMAVVMDADGNTMGRGQVYLTAGDYTVALFSMMPLPSNSFTINITFDAPATGEPDGSELYPFVWETLPESVTFESDNMNMVYYVFTATVDGYVTFTWAVEENDWFNIYELDENGNTTANNASGYAKTSHKFLVEAGKTYRVGLGTWNEGGETVVAIAETACEHSWSEATCETEATCANCGCTTGDKAEHTPSTEEPTCADPAVCTVCGKELSYVDHTWGEPTNVIAPDCSTMTDGSQTITCTVCGATEEETLWAYHTLDETVVGATCTENGSYHAICTVCGYEENNVIEATGHINYFIACEESGECMECGVTFTKPHSGDPATCTDPMFCYECWQSIGEAAGHSFDGYVCTNCGEVKDDLLLVVAGDKDFFGSNWTLEDENNLLVYTDGIYTKTYESALHGIYQFKVIDVTSGYNWDVQINTSNYYFYVEVGSKVVISFNPTTNALIVEVYAPNSDVATDGTTYMVVGDSALCGDVHNTENEGFGWETNNYNNLLTLNADGKYELVYTGVKAGTYEIKVVKNGDYNVAEWGDNGKNYKITVAEDNSIVTILFDVETGTISHSVHAHSYEESVNNNPTCTVAGLATYTCSCGHSYTEEIKALGHADNNGDFKCDACSTKMLPEDGATLTIPEALAIAKLHGHNTYTTQKYYITGIITNVYNTQYGNMYIKDADGNEITIYGLYSYDGETRYDAMSYKPVAGDEITVYTVLGMYNSTAQGKNAWMDDVVAHEHDYVENVTAPTCVAPGFTTHTCSICNHSYTDTETEALGHTTDNGVCGNCNLTIGGSTPVIGQLVEFTFGANGSAVHKDPNTKFSGTKTYTVSGYSLNIESPTNVYDGGNDEKGNSCIKLGTSSKTGSFKFTVGAEVTEVVIYVAQYKANTTKITVNGVSYTITTASNNGEYTAITVDTTTTKTINFATVSGGVRCMIDKIVFKGVVG